MKKTKNDLIKILKDLEKSGQKIVETRGYTKEVEKIKLLEELIKEQLVREQLVHEDSCYSAS